MKLNSELTLNSAQRSALLGLVLEYIQDAAKPGSRLPVEFVIIDGTDTTVSMFDLLNLLTRPSPMVSSNWEPMPPILE